MNYWREGDVLFVEVGKNGQCIKFKVPRKKDLLEDRVAKLEKEVKDKDYSIEQCKKLAKQIMGL